MIITITRECGCRGDEIGRQLASRCDMTFMAKREILTAAREIGLYDRYPMFFGEMAADDMMGTISEEFVGRIHEIPNKVLGEIIGEKDCVIVGRAAFAAFRDRSDVLNVFLCGDRVKRIEHIASKHEISMREAERIVDDTDERRQRYNNYYSGMDWERASNYDICIDVTKLDNSEAEEIILKYAKMMKGLRR